MIDGLQFGVFPEWIELPLDDSPDELTARLMARFSEDPKPEPVKRTIAEGMAMLRTQLVSASDGQQQVFSAWLLVPRGGTLLTPVAAAFGAIVSVDRGTTPSEFVDTLIDGAPLHQPVDLTELATPLGRAHVVRGRTYAMTEHGKSLSETVSVFWLPVDDDIAVVLTSLPVDDLVLAADVASAMRGLAETAAPMGAGA
jgi:hypothetical protein